MMMPTMPPDSQKISLKIIEAIKQHPILYISDVKGPAIKLHEFRQKVWTRISDELGLDSSWVRLRWKNLRDTYCRILKYKNKSGRGARRKKWTFEDQLTFLKFPCEPDYRPQYVEITEEYVNEINSGGVNSEGLLEQLEDRNDEDYSDYLEVLEETTADPIISELPMERSESKEPKCSPQHDLQEDDEYMQEVDSKFEKTKRIKLDSSMLRTPVNRYTNNWGHSFEQKRYDNINIDGNSSVFLMNSSIMHTPVSKGSYETKVEELNQVFVSPKEKGSLVSFFKSMAQTVKRLPLKAQVDIKMRICKIVTEAEVKYLQTQNSQKSVTLSPTIPKLVLIPCSMIDDTGNKS